MTESGCITAIESRPTTPPALEVTKLGPTRHYVGEIAKFRIVIKNTGDVPVTNLEVLDHYDDALEPRSTDSGRELLPNGDFAVANCRGWKKANGGKSTCIAPASRRPRVRAAA